MYFGPRAIDASSFSLQLLLELLLLIATTRAAPSVVWRALGIHITINAVW